MAPIQRQPGVVIIARHGSRLDGADLTWHLSTPTPYDPPLTYAGWGQSRALGVRIATLLEAREKAHNSVQDVGDDGPPESVTSHDFAYKTSAKRKDSTVQDGAAKRKKLRHKVVIHTSPFLRCVQTSVGIAAGMAEFKPAAPSSNSGSKSKSPASLHSATSPRLRALEHSNISTHLSSIPEPKHDLAHEVARRLLEPKPQPRKSKLRVDAFLGEWLNPTYYDQITPPPPSALMVASAKAGLMSNEQVDVYTPTQSAATKSPNNALWGGKKAEGTSIDDMSALHDSLPVPGTRSRSSTVSSAASDEANESGRRSPFRAGHVFKPQHSTLHSTKPDARYYHPPKPQYAISGSEHIPRGYVGHARQTCVDVDIHWDSSRSPQNWPDGGEFGEEWSHMHRRIRKGMNDLISWYSHHDVDARAEDALGIEQVEIHADEDDEYEDELVVVLVTHGADCNALIGALTGQPVLMDVGMASLTMATRRDNAPTVAEVDQAQSANEGGKRRPSQDLSLPSVYEIKISASTEHLRVNPAKASGLNITKSSLPPFRDPNHAAADVAWNPYGHPGRRNVNSALGSIRRPSATNAYPGRPEPFRADSSPMPITSKDGIAVPSPPFTPGLWTPPAARTPVLSASKPQDGLLKTALDPNADRIPSPVPDNILQSPTSMPATSIPEEDGSVDPKAAAPKRNAMALALNGALNNGNGVPEHAIDDRKASLSDLPKPGDMPPQGLSRGLSQKGLWGSKPAGDKVERRFGQEPKRRWTVNQE